MPARSVAPASRLESPGGSPALPTDPGAVASLERIRTCLIAGSIGSRPWPRAVAGARVRPRTSHNSSFELEQERSAAAGRGRTSQNRNGTQRLETLEHDRRLLAEAWERLEREQVEILSATHGQARGLPAGQRVTDPARPRPGRRPHRTGRCRRTHLSVSSRRSAAMSDAGPRPRAGRRPMSRSIPPARGPVAFRTRTVHVDRRR